MKKQINKELNIPTDKMKKITICFDVDGTLRSNMLENMMVRENGQLTGRNGDKWVANENIRTLLICLSKFKNTKIIIWSGGGELYARQAARMLHIEQFVDGYAGKIGQTINPDIVIDDIQDTALGKLNLIVREK